MNGSFTRAKVAGGHERRGQRVADRGQFGKRICVHGLLVLLLGLAQGYSEELRGVVRDASTGELMAEALVRVLAEDGKRVAEGQTEVSGAYALVVPSGEWELRVAAVGYRAFRTRLRIQPNSAVELEVRLVPDTLGRRDSVDVNVSAELLALEEGASVGLAGNELRNLGSVLADDPLRAVHGLPGVAANDGFQSQFTLRGAGFSRLGIYLDGILLRAPFHAVQGETSSASLTVLNGDFMQSLDLYAGAPPPVYMDRTAGALDLRTRAGDPEAYHGRFSASASNLAGTAEGPLGRAKRGSWIASARKSYLQYIINRTTDEPALGFGFWDVQARADYHLSHRHQVSASLIQGTSGLDRSGAEDRVGRNAVFFSTYRMTLATVASTYTPNANWYVSNRIGYMRERFGNENREDLPLAGGYHGEWIYNGDFAWSWLSQAPLQFGWSFRRLRDDGFLDRRLASPPFVDRLNEYRGTGMRSGGYLRQAVPLGSSRVTGSVGVRLDHHSIPGYRTVSPIASLRARLGPATAVHASWGSYAQYPEISQFRAVYGGDRLLPERAIHHQLALEQGVGERTRVRLELYNRLDRDLLFRPFGEPRLIDGAVFNPSRLAPLENSLRGYSRGVQAFVQRRSANGLTGWVSYSYGVARLRDGVSGQHFPADFDQRHTVNVYGSYRLRPTVNLSVRHVYGSGFPVPGFLEGTEDNFFLAAQRNRLRIPEYHRTDVRVNKTWVMRRVQTTLFVEVVNLFNRDNIRFEELSGWNSRTGAARLNFDKLFPIIPSAGLAVEF